MNLSRYFFQTLKILLHCLLLFFFNKITLTQIRITFESFTRFISRDLYQEQDIRKIE